MPNCGYQTFSFRFLGACILRALLYFFPSALSGPLGPGSKTEEELKNRGWFAGGDSGLFHISTQALSDRAPAGVAKAAPWCALPWFQCTHLVVWSWWFFINIRILYPWDIKSRLGFAVGGEIPKSETERSDIRNLLKKRPIAVYKKLDGCLWILLRKAS